MPVPKLRSLPVAFSAGALVGILGGLVGLGGAEFRLPLLIGIFAFGALSAVIVNKTMSLAVVVAAIPARLGAVPLADVVDELSAVVNVLAGSVVGAWAGATWAVRMTTTALYRVLAALLFFIALVFVAEHLGGLSPLRLDGAALLVLGVAAGLLIGAVAALLGVAGGELLIPAFVLLFAVDVKLAGSLSLLVSLPTMLVAFLRYSRDQAFTVIGENVGFIGFMALGSVAGAVAGGLLLGVVPEAAIVPILAALLLISAVKVWSHAREASTDRSA